jgi:starch-binding outer membrane protein, SusD/RagB family
MNKIIYLASFLLALTIIGCSKDFLTVDPVGNLKKEDYLKTDQEVFKAMVGIYDQIQYNYSNGSWASVFFMKNLPADDVLCAGGGPGDQSEYQYLDDFQIGSGNSKILFIWTNFYKSISFCNTVIDVVGNNADATAKMKEMVAEAKGLRAFNYLELVTLFGGVPLLIENPKTTADYHKARATIAEVYAQIESDLNDAIAGLPLKKTYSDANKFRLSKGAAQALLGKALLYEKKYSESATVLAQLIATSDYSLEPNFADNWINTHEFGVESVFELSYGTTGKYDWGYPYWGSNGAYNNIECQLEGPRDAIFTLTNCDLGVVNGWGFNLPSKEIGDLMYARNEVNRLPATLISAADLVKHGAVVTSSTHDYQGYMRLKYVTRSSETSTVGVDALNYGTNWRLIRYADVLLMAAEAYNKSNNDAAAQTELNKVRARAGLSDITSTGTDLFNAIVEEREVELAFEGSRYWDLVRWGLATNQLSDIGFVAGKHEVFPIPLNEIIANTKIEDADQNPGY